MRIEDLRVAKRLWQDDQGFIISMELILIVSIMVIGIMMGIVSIRDGMISEMSDVAGAIQDISQDYSFRGVNGHSASTAGSDFLDARDWCDTPEDTRNWPDNCIFINVAPADET